MLLHNPHCASVLLLALDYSEEVSLRRHEFVLDAEIDIDDLDARKVSGRQALV